MVYSHDGNTPYYGTVIWSDSVTDVAIIKAIDCNLKPLEFADPTSIHMGDETLIFGYSGGNQTTGSLKVTWGLVGSESGDSTIQTTALVNAAGFGGPAINMQGKVIGTVHAKKNVLGFENPAEIKNIGFARDAFEQVKNYTSANPNYYGSTNIDAYKKVCDGALMGCKSAATEDLGTRESIYNSINNLLLEASTLDKDYIEAYYFRAAYFFMQSRFYCLKNMEEESNSIFMTFKQYFRDADFKAGIFKPSLLTMKGPLDFLRKQVNLKEINCEDYAASFKNSMSAIHNRENRIEEFNTYLTTGKSPVLLKQAVGGRSSSTSGGSGGSGFGSEGSSIFFMASIDKERPVRFSVCLPFGFEGFKKNLGLSIGNAGSSKYYSVVFCKYQFSFNLIQDLNEGTDPDIKFTYKRYLMPAFDIGISGNILRMARFNPKPFITVGYNPTFYEEKYDSIYPTGTTSIQNSKFYLGNGSFNFGLDLDIWITSSFGMSLSYQYTLSFANFFPSMYNNDKRLQQMMYSIFKIGILF